MTLKIISFQPLPAMGMDNFHSTRLLKAPSNLALNTSRDGASTASLGNLCQCLTNLRAKNFFLIANLNLPSSSLKPLCLILSLHGLVKSPSPAFLYPPAFRYWKADIRYPQSLLFSRLNSPNSLSLSTAMGCRSTADCAWNQLTPSQPPWCYAAFSLPPAAQPPAAGGPLPGHKLLFFFPKL